MGMLLLCPVCNNDVSSDAVTCPNCGQPLAASATENLAGGFVQGVKWVLLPLLFVILLFLVAT